MKINYALVIFIFIIFFVISFLTNILGPLIPDLVSSFDLSLGLAGFLPFAFFVAYGVASIPSGLLVEKYKEKKVLISAFFLAFTGALLFALMPSFNIALLSLFLIGLGMAMLQVVINPLLRTVGGESEFAFNSVMAQLFFGAASFVSPMLYSYFVQNIHSGNATGLAAALEGLVPQNLTWVSLYWVFSIIALVMVIVIVFVKFPKVELKEDEKIDTGLAFSELKSNKYTWLYFLGIFSYVGTEQGVANWVSQFLQTYHQADPATVGAGVISNYWGLLTVGCLLGLLLLKLFDSRKVLQIFTIGAFISLMAGLFGDLTIARIAFPLVGFFGSVMWSIIVSLALNSVPNHHGTFSGILCTGICGGAIIPLIIGNLADWIGLKWALLTLTITLGYIFSITIWARPLITNSTIRLQKD